MWDLEVDVVCLGAGPSTLASAVATTDIGASVLLATPLAERREARSNVAVQQRVGGFLGSWARLGMDAETDQYLSAITEDACSPGDMSGDSRLTMRTVSPVPKDGAVAAFVGARLGAWNATCLASAYGMLFTSVSGWRTTPMRTEDGQSLEVQPLGSVSTADLAAGFNATSWLQGQLRTRGVDAHRYTELERIVFDNGRIVGVELVTPDGLMAVGVRHGLSLSSGDPMAVDLPRTVAGPESEDLQLCIVGQPASRFRRVELLGTAMPPRPMCRMSGRQLRDGMRVARALPSGFRSCGKPR